MAKYTAYTNSAPIGTDVIGISRSPFTANTFFSTTLDQVKTFIAPNEPNQQILYGTGSGVSSSPNLGWDGSFLVIGGSIEIPSMTVAGVIHNDTSGQFLSSLVVNADIDAAAAITDSKLATIVTAGKVSNSATTATAANTSLAIVSRDASGNFTAGTITGALSGNATTSTTSTNFIGSLSGDVSGTQSATVLGNATVTNAKMAQMAAHTFKGNNTGSSATPIDLTIAQMQAELGVPSGLGTMSTQNANAVAITGGTISGTSLSATIPTNSFIIADGGGIYLKFNSVDSLVQNGGTIMNAAFTFGQVLTTVINGSTIGLTTAAAAKFTTTTITSLAPTAGVVHNDTAGLLSSSLIVNADITAATITNGKLAVMAAHTFKGNNTGSSIAPLDLTIAQMQSELGIAGTLGTMAYQNANAVAITGGSISAATYSRTISAATDFVLVNGAGVYLQFNTTVGLLQNGGKIQNAEFTLGVVTATTMVSSIIDSTTIGATTPSTGKFTTLQATTGLTLPTTGGTPTSLNYYEEFDTTIAVTGPWASQNLTVKFTRIGRIVVMTWGDLSVAITVASQKIASAAGAIPTRFRPVGSEGFAEIINGASSITEAPGIVKALSGGGIQFAAEADNNYGTTGYAGVIAGYWIYTI